MMETDWKHKDILWAIGGLISTLIGFGIGYEYGFHAGIAVGYALLVLVDIRKNTDR